MTVQEMKRIDDMERELKAREEILNALADAGASWMGWVDWRKRLRDFASDSEKHNISKDNWNLGRDGICIHLFVNGDFYTAYFDDASTLWEQADDDLPMHHVMVQYDPPHRTCIHALHLHRWLSHLSETCQPVKICDANDLSGE